MNNLIEQFKLITRSMDELYEQKNKAYGDSFNKSLDEFGPIAGLTRMSDKWNRIKTLIMNSDISQNDESINDTLIDLANYAIMMSMWMKRDK